MSLMQNLQNCKKPASVSHDVQVFLGQDFPEDVLCHRPRALTNEHDCLFASELVHIQIVKAQRLQ